MTFDQFVGQEAIKKDLAIHIDRADTYYEPLDHTILYGGAGLGKTTLSKAIAQEIGTTIYCKTGDELNKKNLWELLLGMSDNDILFIDEIHNMPLKVAEILYGPLQEINNQKLSEDVNPFIFEDEVIHPFTLIGGTTSAGMLSKPMRDRMVLDYHLKPYNEKELVTILTNQKCPTEAAVIIASRSRGVPRISLKYFIRIRNRALHFSNITADLCHEMFDEYGVLAGGFQGEDIEVLKFVKERGHVGQSEIHRTLGLDQHDYVNMYEPFLLQQRLLTISSKGRSLSEKGKKFLEGAK